MRHVPAISVLVLVLAASADAQPRVVNGEVKPAAFTGIFSRGALDTYATKIPTSWLAYAVPLVEGDRWICDGNMYSGHSGVTVTNAAPTAGPTVMMLEGPRRLWVLFRLDAGRVDRIRIASEDCTLDAGGLTVQWVASVPPSESIATLASFFDATATSNKLVDGALVALAMHRDPAALDRLIAAARNGSTTHVRGQALFWLAQRAGEKAIGAISEAIARDPETEVKKRAVFALSQLPKDEGVPRLIEIARTNSNPAVRKQAMFWLGQSRDPRALRFFEQLLRN